jgi:hypothetical protein
MMRSILACAAYEPTETCDSVEYALSDVVRPYGFQVAYVRIPPVKKDPTTPVVLYVGGSGEEMHRSVEKCQALSEMYDAEFIVFALPAPDTHTQYVPALGTVSEEERYAACEAAYQLVSGEYSVYVWGRSMGSSLAARLAYDHHTDVKGLVLEAPLGSVRKFIAQSKPNAAYVLEMLDVDAYSTVRYVEKLKKKSIMKIFVLCMEKDEILDETHSLSVKAANPIYVVRKIVQGAGHGGCDAEDYKKYIPIQFFHPTAYAPEMEFER